MAVRPVLRLPHRVLKEVAEPISYDEAGSLIEDLLDTMRASPACVGLAAPQIGIARRVIVVDVSEHPKTTSCHGLVVLVDPEIVERGKPMVGREGCMSVPDLTANVERASTITIRGVSATGEDVRIATDGFEARAFQHEVDHLDGLLILDRVASLSTDVFKRRVYR